MTAEDAFFTVHRDLPREGPGLARDVGWALDRLGVAGAVRVLDAGCGPGADLETLAGMLPEARITGMDQVAHFVTAARDRVARFGARVDARRGDMAAVTGPYDLIWCAGALYFLGVTEGLRQWRGTLAPGGAVAFSEPVLLSPDEPAPVQAFWEEYPGITGLDGVLARVRAAGYAPVDHRLIIGAAWEAYYRPLLARIDRLRAAGADAPLKAALDASAREAVLWQEARDRIAYLLVLARPE